MKKWEWVMLTLIIILFVGVSIFIGWMLLSKKETPTKEFSLVVDEEELDKEEDIIEPEYETEFETIKRVYIEETAYLEVSKAHDGINMALKESFQKGVSYQTDRAELMIDVLLRDYFVTWSEEKAIEVLTEIYGGYKRDDVEYLLGLTAHEEKIHFMIKYEVRYLVREGYLIN